jgi:hypothetical protein
MFRIRGRGRGEKGLICGGRAPTGGEGRVARHQATTREEETKAGNAGSRRRLGRLAGRAFSVVDRWGRFSRLARGWWLSDPHRLAQGRVTAPNRLCKTLRIMRTTAMPVRQVGSVANRGFSKHSLLFHLPVLPESLARQQCILCTLGTPHPM